jgi:hypothetical protein
MLEHGLLGIAYSGDVKETGQTPHGTKYVIEGEIAASDGGCRRRVRTVWIIDAGQESPRFITAYPA